MTEIKKSKAPDPHKYAENASDEMAIQVAIFMWAAQPENQKRYPELRFLFAIPNGMYTSKIQASRFKAAGMKAGVPDMMLLVKRGEYSGLIIELKRPKDKGKRAGVVSDDQEIWLEFLKLQGYGTIVCYGFEETIKNLMDYLEYKSDLSPRMKEEWIIKDNG